ncbi:MAG: 7-cyano-7-deazaguanine synthase QueC [Rubripirellula sp.]|jgi:7-cyano-7-deazaguanine synthase|nr:7-cyano-7-deazaguanine synthase QueC [Planctomycetaceae bacterium]MDF1844428.1 7-cyano-7-deazaguanine synthase QueC [Rubripirellula sp.]
MSDGDPAVVLLSGGLDSATCLAIALAEGFAPHAISFQYGQRHCYELDRAKKIAGQMGAVSHRVVEIDLAQFGGSALTDETIQVPKSESVDDLGDGIPVTYVPARNTVFLSLALAFAETISSRDLFIGVNALDYSGYPDCRPEFVSAYEAMANLATKDSVNRSRKLTIHTPLIHLSKAQIIARGMELGVDYGATLSCYDPGEGGRPCGKCDACLLRAKGFNENGCPDPALTEFNS